MKIRIINITHSNSRFAIAQHRSMRRELAVISNSTVNSLSKIFIKFLDQQKCLNQHDESRHLERQSNEFDLAHLFGLVSK